MDSNDRLSWAAIIVAIILALALVLSGCAVTDLIHGGRDNERAADKLKAVEVSRVPIVREELPLPEAPENFAAVADYATTDTAQDLATKVELAELAAQIEKIKADTAAEIYKVSQAAKQEIYDQQKTRDIELAGLEEKLQAETKALAEQARAATYDANKWLWAVIAAAVACVVYCYKRVNLAAAVLGLAGFAFLFALILAGKHYPEFVALSPIPFIVLVVYVAWRSGVLTQALTACVRGIEMADNDEVKDMVRREKGADKIEIARKEIDKATVKRDKKAHEKRRASRAKTEGDGE